MECLVPNNKGFHLHSRNAEPKPIITKIALPEDNECPFVDKSVQCSCMIRTGGDVVQGYVEVCGALKDDQTLEIRFEGICRTWISYDLSAVASETKEFRFMQEMQLLKNSSTFILKPDSGADAYTQHLAFSFTIPKVLICPHSETQSSFLQLYPTVRAGRLFRDSFRGDFMQPLIYYRLLAVLRRKQSLIEQVEREVTVLPLKAPDPPLYVGQLADEYRITSKVILRRPFNLFGQSQAELFAEAEEPAPLNLLGSRTPRMATSVPIKIRLLRRGNTSPVNLKPYNWSFTVRSTLNLHTFYSTKKLNKEPTLRNSQYSPSIAINSKIICSEERRYSSLCWRPDRGSVAGGSSHSPLHLPWITKLDAIVSAPKETLPSFLSIAAAVKYSITLKIVVKEIKWATMTLEVPVQVVRDQGTHFDLELGDDELIRTEDLPAYFR